MAELSVQSIDKEGVAVTTTSADSGGDSFPNTGREALIVDNQDSASHTVTIPAQAKCNQGFLHDLEVTVAAGDRMYIGRFDPTRFNDVNGMVQVTYDSVTSLNVAVVQF